MDERFARSLGALEEEELAALRGKKLLIAGCGGLGGYLAEYLLRLGVGELVAADPERFERTNLNRQLLCTEESLGRYKAAAAAARAAAVAPDCRFTGHICRLDEKALPGLLRGCDAALDALDDVESRRLLKAECDRQGIPYVFGAVGGWVAQAALSLPGDAFLDRLYPPDYAQEERSVLPFTCSLGAALQAALCARYLCGRGVEPGRLYSFDLERMDLQQVML
ncbi:MAG: ThiF family adenylyltransferase [Oscillospiraceae bacterium]|nr:ThiF family adenylyltransferase [Oscillospiraceae bacterium]